MWVEGELFELEDSVCVRTEGINWAGVNLCWKPEGGS